MIPVATTVTAHHLAMVLQMATAHPKALAHQTTAVRGIVATVLEMATGTVMAMAMGTEMALPTSLAHLSW